MNILLFARYLADFSIFFPVALLCIAPVRSHMKFPKRSPLIVLGIAAVFWLAFSLFGAVFGANSNALVGNASGVLPVSACARLLFFPRSARVRFYNLHHGDLHVPHARGGHQRPRRAE